MKVHNIIKQKGNQTYSVTSDQTVLEALKLMSEKNIGALLVIDEGFLSGIISERDYARKIILKEKASRDTAVKEIMSKNVITVNSDSTVEGCMELMSRYKIRHLPVVDNGALKGMVSIGDIVNAIIKDQKDTIDHLHEYISM